MIEAIILGIVQGLTEFLPISSSAHIRFVGEFLNGAKDPGARFTAITQIGTELAVLTFCSKILFLNAFKTSRFFSQMSHKCQTSIGRLLIAYVVQMITPCSVTPVEKSNDRWRVSA